MIPRRRELLEGVLSGVIGRLNRPHVERLCAGPRLVRHNATPVDRLVERPVRVLWVAAHPDDESFAGPLLAKAGPVCGNPLHFLVLTRGEGGESCLPLGMPSDLGAARSVELANVARLYGASLELEDFYNAPVPVESFPRRHEIAARWREHKNPALVVARTIREFRPDLLLTFAPDFGSTGHPEHQLASRFATAGIRLAAQSRPGLPGRPHRVAHTCYLLNRYWFTRIGSDGWDPLPWTEFFPVRQPGLGGLNLAQTMAEFTRPHHTQARDMGMMRLVADLFHYLYLYRADPWLEVKDPYEFHPVRGMG